MAYPDWVERERRPGTNISCTRGKYYLYEVTSVWDPVKKRAQKKTGKYLGRITEDGLIPPKPKKIVVAEGISTKEYGASSFLNSAGNELHEKLREYFPEDADRIYTLAVLRVIEKCPFKRAAFLYERSFMSEYCQNLSLSASSLSEFLERLGTKRMQLAGFMRE